MKLQAVLDMVDKIKPGNPFDAATKIQWLNELEGDIQSRLLKTAPQEIIQYTEADLEETLLIPVPYDKVYWMWVAAMIDFANGEYQKYQNTMRMVNDAYDKYAKWFHRHFHQDTGGFLFIGGTTKYGLSAYEIALNHGFKGSEEEWLEYLIGPVGPQGPVGEGLNIVDMLASEADLPNTDELKAGTGYLVGKDADALLFIWNGEEWFFKKSLRGEKGDQGIGIKSIVSEANGTWTVTYTDGTTDVLSNAAYLTLLQTMQTATKETENATSSANTAAKNANDAAGTANTAASAANAAASQANTAASGAYTAAGNANAAANAANSAAGAANTAAQNAAKAEEELRDAAANGDFDGDPFTYDDFTPEQLEALKGEKGDPFTYDDFTPEQLEALVGAPGSSIQKIERTAGNGAPGTTDTYTVTMTDGTTHEFFVYNGKDGEGAGDMTSGVYDPQGKKQDVFKYVDDALTKLKSETWTFTLEDGSTVEKAVYVG